MTRPQALLLSALPFLLLASACQQDTESGNPKSEIQNSNQPPVLPSPAGIAPEQTFALVCSACHGPAGEGKAELKAPAIGGLPSWYVMEQIEKFRNGFRGSHPEDIPGLQMKAIALSFTGDQLEAAARAIEKLPAKPTPIIAGGDVDRGRKIFANNCINCHRFNGEGERVFHSAPLVTLDPDYLRRQLHNYARGWRGASPQDFYGSKMVMVSSGLTDRDIEDMIRYIGELAHGDDPRPAMESY